MNKFIKILIAFVLVLSTVLVFAACEDLDLDFSIKNDSNKNSSTGNKVENGTTAKADDDGGIKVADDTDTRFGKLHTVG